MPLLVEKKTPPLCTCKEIRAGPATGGGDGKRPDGSVRQASTRSCPACAAVRGKKDAAVICPGKEIRARDCKSMDISVSQACTRRTPACAIVGGKEDADISAGKEIRAGNGKCRDIGPFVCSQTTFETTKGLSSGPVGSFLQAASGTRTERERITCLI